VERLPAVSELGDRSRLADRDEDRVVAEALAPAPLLRDPAFECPRAAQLLALGREADELAHVARAALLDALELAEQLLNRILAPGPAVRGDPRATAEPIDLEPRVLAEHRRAGLPHLPAEQGLGARVLVIRLALLRRKVRGAEKHDSPPGQRPLELAALVLVPRAERGR
jgi:hypothetical protein